jgi:hypothetical protein
VIGKAVGETSSCREGEGEDLIYTKCILWVIFYPTQNTSK